MSELEAILYNARLAYDERQRKEKERAAAAEVEQQEQNEKERAEVREWLCTIMPEALVNCIDLSGYSHQEANRSYTTSGETKLGIWLEISLPNAFPIHFNVCRRQDELHLVNEPYTPNNECFRFAVPHMATVERDDDEFYIRYYNSRRRNHADWQTAVGHALALWAEHGERLTTELERERFMGPEPEPEPESKPETTEERIAVALEHIASALDNLAMTQAHFG